jgi:beta-alanine degradation protein BauB
MTTKILTILAVIALATSLAAQTMPTVVPISKEEHHHLVLDNEYVRVYSVEVAPHSETLYHQHDVDYVFVTLSDSDVDSVRVGEQPAHLLLKDGEVRFTKGGFAHKAVNNSDKPFRNVTIELKRPQDAALSSYTVNISNLGMVSINGAPKSATGVHGENFFLESGVDSSAYEAQANPKMLGANSNRLIVAVSAHLITYAGQKEGFEQSLKPGEVIWKKASQPTNIKNEGTNVGRFVVLSFM